MSRDRYSGMNKDRLRRLLGLFFVALAIPSAVLTWQAHSRLQWENFHQYQLLAEGLLGGIDRRVREMIVREEARAFTDYRFLVVEGAPSANYLQRSPLSDFPVGNDIPGLLGYFQIEADGRFTTPLLPNDSRVSALAYGITDEELQQRQALRELLLTILSQEVRVAELSPVDDLEKESVQQVDADEVRLQRPGASVALGSSASGAPDRLDESFLTRDAASAPEPGLGRMPAVLSGTSERETGIGDKEQKLAQAAFDRLSEESTRQRGARSKKQAASAGNIGRVDELKLDQVFKSEQAPEEVRRPLPRFKERTEYGTARVEQSAVLSDPQPAPYLDEPGSGAGKAAESRPLVRIFESEVDPFQFGVLGSEHFVLYRKVWREGQRHIQGAVIQKSVFLRDLVETSYRHTALAGMSRLGIVFGGEILSALGGRREGGYLSSTEELSGTLLYRGRLSTPLDQMELIFSVTSMPAGLAGGLVIWVALILASILSGGLMLMYRLGVKQIELNRQQRDFVSAVSHELKTPLTSIRMYSEMLREGWADEERKRGYYDFIHDESERLSRLITNVLQLARMSRGDFKVARRPVSVSQLMDLIRSKVATQITQAGFEWKLDCTGAAARQKLAMDDDAFVQILINLVDNAIKFSTQADERLIETGCRHLQDGRVEFWVRDHGPGIAKDQMRKIFTLFYRSENELTRETVGTGIGLALVHRLTVAMDGEVDVVNREPGAEFRIRFSTL